MLLHFLQNNNNNNNNNKWIDKINNQAQKHKIKKCMSKHDSFTKKKVNKIEDQGLRQGLYTHLYKHWSQGLNCQRYMLAWPYLYLHGIWAKIRFSNEVVFQYLWILIRHRWSQQNWTREMRIKYLKFTSFFWRCNKKFKDFSRTQVRCKWEPYRVKNKIK